MNVVGFLIIVGVVYLIVSHSRNGSMQDETQFSYEETQSNVTHNHNHAAPEVPYVKQQKVARKGIHCKKCKSLDLEDLSDNSKNVKTSGILLGCLFLPLALLGLNGKNATEKTYRCLNCGNVFKYKIKRKYR